MLFFWQLLCVILGFAFPSFLIKAVRAPKEDSKVISKYTTLSCVSFGVMVFVFVGLIAS